MIIRKHAVHGVIHDYRQLQDFIHVQSERSFMIYCKLRVAEYTVLEYCTAAGVHRHWHQPLLLV